MLGAHQLDAGAALCADTLRLQVGTSQIDSTSHTIYDIKAQRTLPFRYGEISGYVLWSCWV